MRIVITYVFIIAIVLCTVVNAIAQDSTKKPIQAIRTTEQMSIDGVLSESIWQGQGFSNFKQRDPNEGMPVTQRTEIWVAYDDAALYVAARMYDTSPDSIVARLGRRDADISSDYVAVFIDSYHDHRSGFYFFLNAAGTFGDGTMFNDDWDDNTWDGVWDGKVNIDRKGWTAEMRIPYSQLRFQKNDSYVWGINFKRGIARNNEQDYAVYTPRKESGFVSRFLDLVGVENIDPPRRLEVLPYVTSKAEFASHAVGDPFHNGSKLTPATGADFKVGIGSNLTLDGTINPDFGQVEIDPAVVNLTDVETSFDEKRPFFIEGANIFNNFGHGGSNNFWNFNFPNPDFIYSRRIGRAPHGSVPSSDYADVPLGTHILGAAKLTGKLGTSWNIGTIHALTGRAKADIDVSGTRSQTEVEPLTYYGIARAQKEIDDGRQGIGFLSTYTNRFFSDNRLRDEMNSNAESFALDGWTFLDSDKEWVVTGWTAVSRIAGNKTDMLSVQESPRHYFQRPDVDHVHVDSSLTSMTGYGARFWLNKQKGNVMLNAAFGFINPKLDVNDLGYTGRTDNLNGHIVTGYNWTEPGSIVRRANFHVGTFRSYEFGGNLLSSGYSHGAWVQFLNYYSVNWFIMRQNDAFNKNATRGGPLMASKSGWSGNLFAQSDSRKTWVFGAGGFVFTNASNSWGWSLFPEISWNPADNVTLGFSPNLERNVDNAQYIDTYPDTLATSTFNNRYVFSTIDQKTLSASIRVNWAFTPTMSLQVYLQPLMSAGNYYGFKELARSKTYDFNEYGSGLSSISYVDSTASYNVDPDGSGPAQSLSISNPNFNIKSLRGNAVLRWEYLPGSTLYFVWTQARNNYDDPGDVRFGRDFNNLLSAHPDNIFLVKIAYWMNP